MIKLFMYDYEQCDPKRCSGQRLLKRGLIRKLSIHQPFYGILLSSEGTSYISGADLTLAEKAGLGVVDCSWNEILKHDSVPISRLKCRHHRLLPFLVAANTVNYGKPLHLNCAEAVIAALWMLGKHEQALQAADSVNYGEEFLKLNREYLDAYARCSTHERIKDAEEAILAAIDHREEVEEEIVEEEQEYEEIDYSAIWAKTHPEEL